MGLFVLDVIFWLSGAHGQISRLDDVRPVSAQTSAGRMPLMGILAVFVGVFAVLSLAVWVTVWLAIQLF